MRRSPEPRLFAGAGAGLVAGALIGALRAGQPDPAPGIAELSGDGTGLLAWLVIGPALGIVLARFTSRGMGTGPAVAASGVLLGLVLWVIWSLSLLPVLVGEEPRWSAQQAAQAYGELIAATMLGGLSAAMLIVLGALVPAPVARRTEAQPERPRIVILGGGFAGVSAARRLESLAPRSRGWDVTLVSRSNYLLFTPMLAEVASGAIEAQHIGAPVRVACPRTRFVRGEALDVDVARRCVRVMVGRRERELPYDHLVLAMGAEPTYRDLPGLAEHALTLKSLADATTVRDHVIAQLEAAEGEQDAAERRRLLTFVVVGGGFAGTELVAELRDLVAKVARFFPDVRGEAMRYVLVHSRERILPEVSSSLAEFALRQLRERGIEFRLGVRVAGATERALLLEGGESIDAGTMVWTAGNQASAVVQALPFEKGPAGAVKVDASFRVPGAEGVWAIGDCAAIPAEGDSLHPPTAQHALREGAALADGVAAVLRGGHPRPFRFESIGTLVALGHRTAVAELRGARFTGFLAWLMWRAVYLGKLPGLEKKVRVLTDWVVDLAFPRDIVLIGTPERPERKAEVPVEAAP